VNPRRVCSIERLGNVRLVGIRLATGEVHQLEVSKNGYLELKERLPSILKETDEPRRRKGATKRKRRPRP
jgi:hypothetical protein